MFLSRIIVKIAYALLRLSLRVYTLQVRRGWWGTEDYYACTEDAFWDAAPSAKHLEAIFKSNL